MKLIIAQGNPEPKYNNTRHNVGFFVLNNLAGKSNTKWVNKPKFNADIAELSVLNEKIILVKPTTFYNDTGISARKVIDFFKITSEKDILVIHDDLALPFGTIRVRGRGSDAGNNGIKSINSHMGTAYLRIRIGIYNESRDKMDDADFVLSKFKANEYIQLKNTVLPAVIDLVYDFCNETIKQTSYKTLKN